MHFRESFSTVVGTPAVLNHNSIYTAFFQVICKVRSMLQGEINAAEAALFLYSTNPTTALV